jgi:hypothetical protein
VPVLGIGPAGLANQPVPAIGGEAPLVSVQRDLAIRAIAVPATTDCDQPPGRTSSPIQGTTPLSFRQATSPVELIEAPRDQTAPQQRAPSMPGRGMGPETICTLEGKRHGESLEGACHRAGQWRLA